MVRGLRVLAAPLAALALTGCSGESGVTSTAAEPPATTEESSSDELAFARGRAVIATDDANVRLDVEIAETDEQRQQGLMFRRSLARNAGMVFVFDGPTQGGFWMKDTLVPLSIAFLDEEGRVLRMLDMEPCTADPCPSYDPNVAYFSALEVNQGVFRANGVEPGDIVTVERG